MGRWTDPAQYALYRGDELLHIGTAREIADAHGVRVETVRYYGTPTWRRRSGPNGLRLVRIDGDESP